LREQGAWRQGDTHVVVEDLFVSPGGSLAFVADRDFGLRIYSAAGNAPEPRGTFQSSNSLGPALSVAYHGSFVYLGHALTLSRINVSDPDNPVFDVNIGNSLDVRDIEVQGNRLFVSARGLRIYDVSNPSAAVPAGAYTTGCSDSGDVAVDGDLVVLACGDTFHFIDVSTSVPFSFAQQKVRDTSQHAAAVAVRGSTTFLASESEVISLSGLTLVDARPIEGVVKLVAPAEGHVVASAGDAGIYQWRVPVLE
jgi:hypothetical protein